MLGYYWHFLLTCRLCLKEIEAIPLQGSRCVRRIKVNSHNTNWRLSGAEDLGWFDGRAFGLAL
jgi:hypothetical protein